MNGLHAALAAPAAANELDWGGHRLVLVAEKAAWLPQRRMLLVADVHIGKALSFRRLGVPVPHGTTAETLARLGALLAAYPVEQLVFLGDLLHSRAAHAPATQAALRDWREKHRAVAMTLVGGNHDRHAGELSPDLAVALVDEPWLLPALQPGPSQGLALCHHPRPLRGWQVLAGHLHPAVSLGARARDRLRLPCFHFDDHVGVLPAFGGFTGMHPIRREAGDRVFAIADAVVYRV